jgi:hypothetical protein
MQSPKALCAIAGVALQLSTGLRKVIFNNNGKTPVTVFINLAFRHPELYA